MHSTLGITSLLKRQPLKHNVIDRDKIVVPPNWDSWGKIRVLVAAFDVEAVSQAWFEDIEGRFGEEPLTLEILEENRKAQEETAEPLQTDSAIARYEDWCQEFDSGGLSVVEHAMNGGNNVNIHSDEPQVYLESQLKILEAFKAKRQPEKISNFDILLATGRVPEREAVSDHIGPVQFNVGGIQVDADDMLRRLKVCTAPSTPANKKTQAKSPSGPNRHRCTRGRPGRGVCRVGTCPTQRHGEIRQRTAPELLQRPDQPRKDGQHTKLTLHPHLLFSPKNLTFLSFFHFQAPAYHGFCP